MSDRFQRVLRELIAVFGVDRTHEMIDAFIDEFVTDVELEKAIRAVTVERARRGVPDRSDR